MSDILSRLGACIHSNFSQPYGEFLDFVDALGLRFIKVKVDIPEFTFALYDKRRRRGVKDLLDSYALRFSMHAPYLNMNISSLNNDLRRASIKTLLRSLELASYLDIDMVSTHVGRLSKDLPRRYITKAADAAKASLRKLKRASDEEGIALTIENDHKTTDHLLAGYPDQIEGLVQELDCGFTLDLGHANTLVEPTQFIDALSDRIVDVHLHDNHGGYDSHLAVGEGNIDFRRQLEALERVGSQGPLIMEQYRLQDFEIGYGRLKHIAHYVTDKDLAKPA